MPNTEETIIQHRQADGVNARLVGAFTALPALIEQFDVDPALVFSIAGVDRTTFIQATNFVLYEDLANLLHEASRQTNCPHFGFLAGRLWQVSDLGLIGNLMLNSPTIGSALQELELHQYLNSQGAVVYLLQREDSVDLGFAMYASFEPKMHHVHDAAMAAGRNFLNELCDGQMPLSDVYLSHSRPDDIEPYRRFFRAPLHFNSPLCALRISKNLLKKPIKGAQPELLEICRKQIKALGRASPVEMASRSLRTLLLLGNASGEQVARSLAMHRRTLNRRLANEGVSFQEVLDKVRFAVATDLLKESKIKTSRISEATGYSDPPSFVRAFKKWSGLTPSQWRQRARAG